MKHLTVDEIIAKVEAWSLEDMPAMPPSWMCSLIDEVKRLREELGTLRAQYAIQQEEVRRMREENAKLWDNRD